MFFRSKSQRSRIPLRFRFNSHFRFSKHLLKKVVTQGFTFRRRRRSDVVEWFNRRRRSSRRRSSKTRQVEPVVLLLRNGLHPHDPNLALLRFFRPLIRLPSTTTFHPSLHPKPIRLFPPLHLHSKRNRPFRSKPPSLLNPRSNLPSNLLHRIPSQTNRSNLSRHHLVGTKSFIRTRSRNDDDVFRLMVV